MKTPADSMSECLWVFMFYYYPIKMNDEVACIYHNIGRAYQLKNEYERAIDNYKKSFEMHTSTRPPRFLNAAKSLNGIGVVYNEITAYYKALEYLIKPQICIRKAYKMNTLI
ncbi:unnamed protein product [Didymodactylos carnosus]|uniref:Uncharacterized protein n=1 Tax=Didymodactylos carnosus TaxID=1234261 RepID=A0A8S2VIL9_9BILA|nr:unnamed protein product [Didymodactylos carnosus]CAF4402165.1 unnamed protein product [Didymodactylos carnosus]